MPRSGSAATRPGDAGGFGVNGIYAQDPRSSLGPPGGSRGDARGKRIHAMGWNNKLGCPSSKRTARGSHPAHGAPGSFGGLWGRCVLGSRHRMCSPSPRGQGAAALPPPDLALPFGAENIPPGISKFSTRAARRTVARGQTDGRPAAAPRGPVLVTCAWWRGLGTIPGAPRGLHVPPAQSRDDPSLDPPRVPPGALWGPRAAPCCSPPPAAPRRSRLF